MAVLYFSSSSVWHRMGRVIKGTAVDTLWPAWGAVCREGWRQDTD